MHISSGFFSSRKRLFFFCSPVGSLYQKNIPRLLWNARASARHESSFIKAAAIKTNVMVVCVRVSVYLGSWTAYSVNKFCNFITYPFAMVRNNHQLQAAFAYFGIAWIFFFSLSCCCRCGCVQKKCKMWCQIISMQLIRRVIYWHLIVYTDSVRFLSFIRSLPKKIFHEKSAYFHYQSHTFFFRTTKIKSHNPVCVVVKTIEKRRVCFKCTRLHLLRQWKR